MRTIRTIKSGSKEKEEYYTNDESLKKDEYYSEAEMESAEHKVTTAQWMGPKAASLGLTGDVEQAKFKQLFYGYLPGTSQRIRGDRKHGQENLAVDCTLSAPKSFSMHALTDLRLYDVHMEACRRTQAELDQRYGFQRKFIDGKQVNVMGDGLIVAAIPHWTSREDDMMLHTHLVIFNGVQGPDGKWRAFDDRQFSYAEWAGSFYRNELAKLTQEAGYRIREVALPSGGYSFEIEGISRSEIEHFSKRSMQIAEAAEVKGVERNAVVLTTRKAKRISKTWQEFRDGLTQEMEHRGVELQTPSAQPIENPIGRTNAAEEIDSAIRHLSERSVSFKREDLYKYALDHIQQLDLNEIDAAINTHPELIEAQDKKRFTTVNALEREIRTIQTWEKGKGKANPVLNEIAAINALESLREVGLNQGQAEAIVGVLSATDRHLIIHGLAGVGKTTALRQLKHLIEENGSTLTIRGYSPTIKAAKHLGAEIGIETNTVEHLVLKTAKGTQNELWIIDEAGMASARQMEAVLSKADEIGARILLVGDTNQNHSIEAGSPMKSLMKYGVTAFNIHEIIRQKDENQKRAVELASSGHGAEALSLLCEHGWVKEIEDCNARAQAAAQEWLSLSPEDRDDTLIVTGTNAERLRINECLRWGLREEGNLGEDHTFKQLVSRQFTDEEKSRAENYSKGDYIRLNWQYKTTPLQKDKLYQVVGKKEGELLVETEGGRLYWFDPSKYKDKEVFYEQDIALAVGDRLRWRITNKEKGQINGTEFTVKAIDGNRLAVIDEKGQLQIIDASKPLGLDYALVWTAHGAQGLSKKRVIVVATSGPTSAKEPFYVKISRQKKHIVIFADNLEKLHKWVSRSAAQDNPLEMIGEEYGNPADHGPETGLDSPAERSHSITESGTTTTESGTEIPAERGNEHSADYSQGRTAKLPDPVHPSTGESGTVENSGGNQGVIRHPQGAEGASDQLGIDPRGHDGSGELRDGRDQDIQRETAQPVQWGQVSKQLIQGLDEIAEDQLVHESGVLDLTCELVESLDQFVAGPQSNPAQPRQYQGIDRAVEALVDGDDAQLIAQSGIVQEVKDVIHQLDKAIEPNVPANLEQIGEEYVGQNSSSESIECSIGRDSGVEPDGRNSGYDRNGADLESPSRESVIINRNEAANRELARGDGRADQSTAETNRNQERDFTNHQASPGDSRRTAQNRQSEHRDVSSKPEDARTTNRVTESSDLLTGTSGDLQWIADAIYRTRIQRELAEPLALLQSTLAELKEVNRLNNEIKAEIDHRQVDIAAKQANVSAKLQQYLAQAKVEVLDTTLSEWRSLRQEPGVLELPEPAMAISDKAALSKLIENYPAQKAIEFAMAQYYQASDQVIDLETSLKTGVPVFRLDELLAGSLSNKSKEVDRPVTQTIERPQKPRPVTVEELNNIRALTRPEKPTQRVKQPQSKISKPIKSEAPFWTPDYSTAKRPDFIEPHHWEEFKQSAIHPDVIATRFKSVEDMGVYERLLSDKFMTMGAGQEITKPMQKMMDEFAQVAEGAWWYKAGKKVLDFPNLAAGQNPAVSTGGSLKPDPDNRREDTKKTNQKRERDPNAPTEFIKYENPLGPKKNLFERDLFFGDVPEAIAQRIYDKYNVTPTPQERAAGFWYVVYKHTEIPIYRIEGSKKDAALTSQGRAVIGGSGVNAGYRSYDLQENKLERRLLHPQLEVFAQPGREFRFANDQDTTVSSILNVRRDTVREAELLEERGSKTLNIKWDGSGDRKGVDDLIAKDGPLAFEKADRNAYPMQREANIHYRTQYNALASQVRKAQPNIAQGPLDIEVYLRAIAKGDLLDGDRILSQSDQARILKDPEKIKAYIEHIKTIAPAYVQQQRELAKAQATQRQQQSKDRTKYEVLAQRVRNTPVKLSTELVDTQVHWIADNEGQPGDGDRLIAQSDHARSLSDPQQVSAYVEHIRAEVPLLLERIRENARIGTNRWNYERLYKQVTQEVGDIPAEQLDMEIYLRVQSKGEKAETIIAQSDQARSLSDPEQVTAYLERIKTQAPQYKQQQIETAKTKAEDQKQVIAQAAEGAQRDGDRVLYLTTEKEVKQTLGNITPEQLDVEVYRKIDKTGNNPDRVLAQSDRAQKLGSPGDVKAYVEQIKTQAQAAKRVTRKVVAAVPTPETKESRDQKNRDIYNKIADELVTRFEPIEPKHLNAAVYQIAKAQGLDCDAIIRHSPDVRGLNDEMAEKYIKRNAQLAKRLVLAPKATKSKVVAKTPKDVQKQRELAKERQQPKDRAVKAIAVVPAPESEDVTDQSYPEIYNKIADEIAVKFEPINKQHLNAAIYQIAKARGLDCDAIIRQSPAARGLEGRLADVYVQRSATLAKRLVLEPKVVKIEKKKIAENLKKSEKPKVQNIKLNRAKKQDRGISR